MKKTFLLFFLTLSLTKVALSASLISDEMGYDEIISQLNRSQTTTTLKPSNDPFENLTIHAGVGFITSNVTVSPVGSKDYSSFLKGVEASLGIDLFSQNWSAEGAVRSFGAQEGKDAEYSLKEFDLRIVYRNSLAKSFKIRTGFGISARYLDFTPQTLKTLAKSTNSLQSHTTYNYTTPASVLFAGVEGYLTPSLSLGGELSYRSSLIDETPDKSTLEASLKVETHF